MSSDTEMSSAEEIAIVSKKERRDKKEKKVKKEKKGKKRAKAESKAEAAESDSEDAAETPAKKRKREALPEELEIDVNLPEPASKKAARKAKKAKLNPTPAADADGEASVVKTEAKTDGNSAEDRENAAKRSEYGVWIGNLPWSATKESLRKFLTDNTEIPDDQITRIHMPPPTRPPPPSWTTKPMNKGFAYVDFSTELSMYSAIALTEMKMDNRALLIKNAKSFDGRPDKPKTEETQDNGRGAKDAKPKNPPNKRVFVGNLSFDVTQEDLKNHYAPCGRIDNIHMATFEDSGKCKGFAWVTFRDVEAATAAVKGFVFKDPSAFKNKKDRDESDSEVDTSKPVKQRKWLVNKLMGRELRREFAEDNHTRYHKRFGHEKEGADGENAGRERGFGRGGGGQRGGRQDFGESNGGRGGKRKVDPRNIKSGAAHMSTQRASQAIVESQGKKTTFD
ncbi:uncharacterized protein J4E84_006643 [Alternaria hordeiaustralica]|uniref:uncharacterized protein n=1 Tax=Alternaria hordeiaustralica TaxID=1187925 RepID=UPI0020C4D00A|nr:uncharacterized protein J4E84_006643 [Alternaria hordeiaustralica]KAI4683804.1 hypothetical protein J4E84_006643 [Alternaria hordeiaustralica]